MPKPVIRSSSLPLFMACSNAVLNPDGILRVEGDNETALLGTLVHGLCESIVKFGHYDLGAIQQRVSDEDFVRASALLDNFLSVWREAAKVMTDPVTEWAFEVELSHVVITGHVDIHHADGQRAFVIDYKTGRQHEDHYHQMAAYAFGVWDKAGRPEAYTVYVTAVYLEDNSVHPYTFTPERLRAWEAEIGAQVMQPRYTAGRKCALCSLNGVCPAYRQYVAGSLRVMGAVAEDGARTWDQLDPEERGEIIDRIYAVEKLIEKIKLTLRNKVKTVGRLAVGKGMEYVLRESEIVDLDTVRALPILNKRLKNFVMSSGALAVGRLNLNAVLSAYAERAAKGQKTKARKELFDELDAAGAIVRVKDTKMWRRPEGEAVMEGNTK